MEKTWFCQLEKGEGPITVGDLLILNCEGEILKTPLKKESLSLQTQTHHSLVLLETLKVEPNSLSLKVTSYRTGFFQSDFYITDGQQFVKVEDLQFQVQSLLTEKDQKPHPALGPFFPQNFSFLFSLFFLSCFVLLSCLFFYRFFKRTHFVKNILKKRRFSQPSKTFIIKLRKEIPNLKKRVIYLETNFKAFLEEQLLIPVKSKSRKKIMKNIKIYHPRVYKKLGLRIDQLLKEFSVTDSLDLNYKNFLQLKKISQDIVFLIEEDLG